MESCPEKTTSLYACLKASEVAGIPPTTICLGNFRLELLGGGSFILMAIPYLQRYPIESFVLISMNSINVYNFEN